MAKVPEKADDFLPDEGTVPTVRVEGIAWSGPLPPPAVLKEFDQIVENGAERIFRQWETETQHRRELERKDLDDLIRDNVRSRWFAFSFVMAALAVCVVAIVFGAPWVAAVLGGGTIASVVWAFIKTRNSQ